ncbi:hypothetical protein Drorol1_Dr00011838 [Drosera rotundifolia]
MGFSNGPCWKSKLQTDDTAESGLGSIICGGRIEWTTAFVGSRSESEACFGLRRHAPSSTFQTPQNTLSFSSNSTHKTISIPRSETIKIRDPGNQPESYNLQPIRLKNPTTTSTLTAATHQTEIRTPNRCFSHATNPAVNPTSNCRVPKLDNSSTSFGDYEFKHLTYSSLSLNCGSMEEL